MWKCALSKYTQFDTALLISIWSQLMGDFSPSPQELFQKIIKIH